MTPIVVSRLTWRLIIFAVIAFVLLLLWAVPILLVMIAGGFAFAVVLAWPVHMMTKYIPHWLSILIAFAILLFVVILLVVLFVPLFGDQLDSLAESLPSIIDSFDESLRSLLESLYEREFIATPPDETMDSITVYLTDLLGTISEGLLGGALGFVAGAFNFFLAMIGALFVSTGLLANDRALKTMFLRFFPRTHRADGRSLWGDLSHVWSHYVAGLGLVIVIQGVATAIALNVIGVPYALALGAFVSVMAVLPTVGAFISAVPAVLIALSVSTETAIWTVILFVIIQQLEGNVLTPLIQGRTLRLPQAVVFLAVVTGGALFGILGILFAVPIVAASRVLIDFFRLRIRVAPS